MKTEAMQIIESQEWWHSLSDYKIEKLIDSYKIKLPISDEEIHRIYIIENKIFRNPTKPNE